MNITIPRECNFAERIRTVLPHVSKDTMRPVLTRVLTRVRLHERNGYLYADATDSYTAVRVRLTDEPLRTATAEGFDVQVEPSVLKSVVAAVRKPVVPVNVEVDDDGTVTFHDTVSGASFSGRDFSSIGEYPNLNGIGFSDPGTHVRKGGPIAPQLAFGPQHFAKFAAANLPKDATIRFQPFASPGDHETQLRPTYVTLYVQQVTAKQQTIRHEVDWFAALVMPVRIPWLDPTPV